MSLPVLSSDRIETQVIGLHMDIKAVGPGPFASAAGTGALR
jgi:hypothetical protein